MTRPFARFGLAWLAVVLLLSGCLKPLVTGSPTAPALTSGRHVTDLAAPPPIVGQVESFRYRTQASEIKDIAAGSTVSLIDTVTNHTLYTTVTNETGGFKIAFTRDFVPDPSKVFYLEAYKGLPQNGTPNRAGVSMARVRTLIRFDGSVWKHLYPTDSIRISVSSTALSIITSLRAAAPETRVDPMTLMGSVDLLEAFTPGSSGVTNGEFVTVRNQVSQSLQGDQDPLYRITYDLASRNYFLVERGIEISSVQPLSGPIGTTVTIQGSNLGTAPVVRFNGAVATSSVNGVSSVITTTVPRGSSSGPVTVQVGDIVFNGANFAVSPWDGHNVWDSSNNMYVSSSRDHRIYRFDPSGNATVFATGGMLNYPRGLVVDPQDNVYVANWDGNNILKIDPSGTVSVFATGGGLNRPIALALNGQGDLFIANHNSHNILKVASGSATPTTFATSANFSSPWGLAFDSKGDLYSSQRYNGTIQKIAPDGTVTQFAAGLSEPGTLAFDSSDNLYIPCYATHNVFKITPQGGYSVFTSMPNYPGWAAMNPDGTLYVGSYLYNYIAKVDRDARVTDYYSSGHLTWSIKSNPANQDLYVSSGWGWGYRTKAVYRMARNAAATETDGYNPPVPVIKDLPNPSAIDYVDPTTMYVGDWGGFIFRANPTTGTYNTYAANLGAIGDITHDSSGNVYAAGWGNHNIYHFSGNSLSRRLGNFWYLNNATFGPDGYMYVPDYWQGKVLRVSPQGVVTTYSDNGGSGFSNPHGVTFDTSGNLYVSSWGGDRIYKVATGSMAVSTYATGMRDPNGLAFDTAGNLYVSNYDDSTIKKIPPGGGSSTNLATGLNNPRGLAINPADGTLYAPAWNGTVYKVTSAGAVSTYATGLGNCMQAFLDSDGNLLVASYGDRAVYVIPPGGGTPSESFTLPIRIGGALKDAAGNLYALTWDAPNIYRIDNGSSRYRLWASGLRTPGGLALDPGETSLYVADFDNYVVNKVDLTTGAISIASQTEDWGIGREELKGITFGSDGKLYVSAWGGGIFQLDTSLINPNNGAGAVRYGNNTSGNGILGGIAFGANGNLYGTTWDWTNNGSAAVTTIPAGGLNGTPLRNFPNRIGF